MARTRAVAISKWYSESALNRHSISIQYKMYGMQQIHTNSYILYPNCVCVCVFAYIIFHFKWTWIQWAKQWANISPSILCGRPRKMCLMRLKLNNLLLDFFFFWLPPVDEKCTYTFKRNKIQTESQSIGLRYLSWQGAKQSRYSHSCSIISSWTLTYTHIKWSFQSIRFFLFYFVAVEFLFVSIGGNFFFCFSVSSALSLFFCPHFYFVFFFLMVVLDGWRSKNFILGIYVNKNKWIYL